MGKHYVVHYKRRMPPELFTRARRIAANIAKPPELLRKA
jgi:hypothetical protein